MRNYYGALVAQEAFMSTSTAAAAPQPSLANLPPGVPAELLAAVNLLAATSDREEIAAIVIAIATGAADATAENCALMLEGLIPTVEAAFPVPAGQVAVARLSATFEMLRKLAGAMREMKSADGVGQEEQGVSP